MKEKVLKAIGYYVLILVLTIIYSEFIKRNSYEETLDYIGLGTFIYTVGLVTELIIVGIKRNN